MKNLIFQISNNPLRILGLYSNFTKKEFISNKSKIEAFSRIDKIAEFESDYVDILGEFDRNTDSIISASNSLNIKDETTVAKLFWFINQNSVDKLVHENLRNGNLEKAKQLCISAKTPNCLHNLMIINFISQDYKKGIKLAEENFSNLDVKNVIFNNMNIDIHPSDEFIFTMFSDAFSKSGLDILEYLPPQSKWRLRQESNQCEILVKKINLEITKLKNSKITKSNIQSVINKFCKDCGNTLSRLHEVISRRNDLEAIYDRLLEGVSEAINRFWHTIENHSKITTFESLNLRNLYAYIMHNISDISGKTFQSTETADETFAQNINNIAKDAYISEANIVTSKFEELSYADFNNADEICEILENGEHLIDIGDKFVSRNEKDQFILIFARNLINIVWHIFEPITNTSISDRKTQEQAVNVYDKMTPHVLKCESYVCEGNFSDGLYLEWLQFNLQNIAFKTAYLLADGMIKEKIDQFRSKMRPIEINRRTVQIENSTTISSRHDSARNNPQNSNSVNTNNSNSTLSSNKTSNTDQQSEKSQSGCGCMIILVFIIFCIIKLFK